MPHSTIPNLPMNCITSANWYLELIKMANIFRKGMPLNIINEITVGIDFTARDIQNKLKDKGLPWEKAKAFEKLAVVGSFIDITLIANKQNINFNFYLNSELKQQGNSSNMIFNFDYLVAHISSYFSLNIGDLIFTGTPAGVGECMAGDILEAFIEKELLLRMEIK